MKTLEENWNRIQHRWNEIVNEDCNTRFRYVERMNTDKLPARALSKKSRREKKKMKANEKWTKNAKEDFKQLDAVQ